MTSVWNRRAGSAIGERAGRGPDSLGTCGGRYARAAGQRAGNVRAVRAGGSVRCRTRVRCERVGRSADGGGGGDTGPCARHPDRLVRRLRGVHRRHGRTYFLATRLLRRWKRRPCTRCTGSPAGPTTSSTRRPGDRGERAARLARWTERSARGCGRAPVDDPLLPAVLHTVAPVRPRPARTSTAFMASMADGPDVDRYPTYEDLRGYMHGSAAVIGDDDAADAGRVVPRGGPRAGAALGLAFQLTNFLRDVARTSTAAASTSRWTCWPRTASTADCCVEPPPPAAATGGSAPPGVEATAPAALRQAAPGIAMLDPVARPCIRTALRLYGGDPGRDRRATATPCCTAGAAVPRRAAWPSPCAASDAPLTRRCRGGCAADGGAADRHRRCRGGRRGEPAAPGRGEGAREAVSHRRARPRRRRLRTWERSPPPGAGPAGGDRRRARTRAGPSLGQLVRARRDPGRSGRDRPFGRTVAGLEVVPGADGDGRLLAGPGACPHLGRPAAATAAVHCGTLVCRWHGWRSDGAAVRRLGDVSRVRRRGAGVGAAGRGRAASEPTDAPVLARPAAARQRSSRSSSRAGTLRAARTSSPTGSTRGTAPGCTRTRSATYRRRRARRGRTEDGLVLDVAYTARPHVRGAGARRVHLPRTRTRSSCTSPTARAPAPSSRRTPRRSARTGRAAAHRHHRGGRRHLRPARVRRRPRGRAAASA